METFKQIVIGFLIGLVVLFFGIWIALFALQSASLPPVIAIRKTYLEKFLPWVRGVKPVDSFSFSSSWMPFTFLTRQKQIRPDKTVIYVQCFLGTYQKIDFSKKILSLNDKKGQSYNFKIFLSEVEEYPDVLKFKYNLAVTSAELQNRYRPTFILVSKKQATDSPIPINKGDVMRVCWDDSRTLWQALKGRKLNEDQSLNLDGNQIFEITRYVQ